MADQQQPMLAITVTGKPYAIAHHLTWEELDRWLATAAERFDAESRTGFLIRQFRAYLPELGIEYFSGFDPHQVEAAPHALTTLGEFYQSADQFFERYGATLISINEGMGHLRSARPEDLLAGYSYRDFSAPLFGPGDFVRTAFHLPNKEFQVALWLVPGVGGDSHARFREALLRWDDLGPALRKMEHDPLLWLWSPTGERRIPIDELDPAELTGLPWGEYHISMQCSMRFEQVTGEGLVNRTVKLTEDLLQTLAPFASGQFH